MKKTLFNLFLTAIITITFSLNALAAVNSVNEIKNKIISLNKLANADYYNYMNKNEVIGNRLQKFDMLAAQYKNETRLAIEGLNNNIEQINILQRSSAAQAPDSTSSIKKIYQETDAILVDMDSKTIKYLYDIRGVLPSITYQKYSKKFCEFYNTLKISGTKIVIK